VQSFSWNKSVLFVLVYVLKSSGCPIYEHKKGRAGAWFVVLLVFDVVWCLAVCFIGCVCFFLMKDLMLVKDD
jgi:hypothetical protein